MKKAIFALIVAIATTTCAFGQMKVSSTSTTDLYKTNGGQIKMTKISVDSLHQYVLYYKNLKYTQILDIDYIKFTSPEEAIDFLDVAIGVIDSGNNVIITLGSDLISINKWAGEKVTIQISGSYFVFSKKQCLELIEVLKAQL
jgi:hypothetical protein